jgi:hypothetical protein
VPRWQPPEPRLQIAPHHHADHVAHVPHTLLRSKLDRRRSLLLSFWLQLQAGAPVQACLDRHLHIDPRPADVPGLDPWLGVYDPAISPVDLRVDDAVSLERQNEQARPLLLQTMNLRGAVEVFHGEDRCDYNDAADEGKASGWHIMCVHVP